MPNEGPADRAVPPRHRRSLLSGDALAGDALAGDALAGDDLAGDDLAGDDLAGVPGPEGDLLERHPQDEAALDGEALADRSLPRPHQIFHVLPDTPCPYLPGRWERKLVTEVYGRNAGRLYSRLSRAGFRRSHHFAYRPACSACDACVPVRVAAGAFAPGQSLRRIARRNGDLLARLRPPSATAEQYELFSRYLGARHADGEMAGMSFADYRAMVEDTSLATSMLELRDADGRLLAACLADWLGDGVSAVYSFFDPAARQRSLGKYCVLALIGEARRRGLPYVYLGYWIAESPKMAYKADFRPLEGLVGGAWRPVTS